MPTTGETLPDSALYFLCYVRQAREFPPFSFVDAQSAGLEPAGAVRDSRELATLLEPLIGQFAAQLPGAAERHLARLQGIDQGTAGMFILDQSDAMALIRELAALKGTDISPYHRHLLEHCIRFVI